MLFVRLNLFYCNAKLTYVSILTYAIFCFAGIKTLFELPYCFKNTSDADKAIEDHALATHASFSVYKTEKGFNSKGKHAKR